MSERLLPEAIRGSWYFLPMAADPTDPSYDPEHVYSFSLDGSFSHFTVRGGSVSDEEKGDYTFDGHFLILRGRQTDTYRVKPLSFWAWRVQGKREDWVFARGKIREQDFFTLEPAHAKEIRILPIRVGVRRSHDVKGAIHEFVFDGSDGTKRPVAAFFTESDPEEQRLWVGITPYVEGIEPKTWERIVHESFLDMHLGKPEDIRVVTVRLVDSNESRVFNYEMSGHSSRE